MRKFSSVAVVAAAIMSVTAGGALAEGDAKKGAKVFKKCKACHQAEKEKNKVGPHLVGIIGRKAGSVESYKKYSKAMKAKAEEIGEWDEAKLSEFLADPKKYLGGKSSMTQKFKKEKDRLNVIAYLKSLAK